MQTRWNSMTNLTASFIKISQQAYQVVSSSFNSIVTSPNTQNFLYSFSIKSFEGLTRILDPSNVTKIFQSNKTRHTLIASLETNVIYYLGVALLLEKIKKEFDYINDSYDSCVALYTLNTIQFLINAELSIITLHRMYENTVLNLALAKEVVDENPISQHYSACGCGDVVSAACFSVLNFNSKIMLIAAATYVPIVNQVAPIAYAYVYGESLAEYLYSSIGTCTLHRSQELAKHKAYSLALGVSLYSMEHLFTHIIANQMGLSSTFINNAVYSAIYPYYIVSALLRDRPIPGDQHGVELFYYHRYLLQKIAIDAKQCFSQFLKNYDNTKNNDHWKLICQLINRHSIPNQLFSLLAWDVNGDWRTLEGFIKNPSNVIFYEEYYPLVKKYLDITINLRTQPLRERPLMERPLAAVIPYISTIPDWLTSFVMSQEYKDLTKIIFDKKLEDPLKHLQHILKVINDIQENSHIKVTIHDKKRWSEMLQAIPQLNDLMPEKELDTKTNKALCVPKDENHALNMLSIFSNNSSGSKVGNDKMIEHSKDKSKITNNKTPLLFSSSNLSSSSSSEIDSIESEFEMLETHKSYSTTESWVLIP